jgi:hypothetical protein
MKNNKQISLSMKRDQMTETRVQLDN